MRLVFSRCAPAQRHLTWEVKQNTCEPCNASTTTRGNETKKKMEKTTLKLFRPDPAEYRTQTELQIYFPLI